MNGGRGKGKERERGREREGGREREREKEREREREIHVIILLFKMERKLSTYNKIIKVLHSPQQQCDSETHTYSHTTDRGHRLVEG